MSEKIKKGNWKISFVVESNLKKYIDLLIRQGVYKNNCELIGDLLKNINEYQ